MNRTTAIWAAIGGLIFTTLVVIQYAQAESVGMEPQRGAMSEVASRMVSREVGERLSKTFENEELAAAFCRNPAPILREMGVPIPPGATVSAALISSEVQPESELWLSTGGVGAPVPNIYGKVCITIGNVTSCWLNFGPLGWKFVEGWPGVIRGFEQPGFGNQIQKDLQSSQNMMAMMKDPRAYIGKLGVKVSPQTRITAELHTGKPGSSIPPWPACVTFQLMNPNSALDYTICAGPARIDGGGDDDLASCCSLSGPSR